MTQIKVVLVDDHATVRSGLCALLGDQEDIQVAGQAVSAEDALEIISSTCPDVIVMDLSMPGMNAFDAIRKIRQDQPSAGVVVFSMHNGSEIVTKALESGADGYVPKSSAHTDLLRAIRTVHSGRAYLHPAATTVLVQSMRNAEDADVLLATLSDREREVMRLTARGYSSREIADILAISSKTVDTYRARLMEKLALRHRWELVDLAHKAGMLESNWIGVPDVTSRLTQALD